MIKQLIYKADYTGWYCTFDERFWTEKDVVDGLCPDCKRPVEHLSESNYFFKMGQYQERLIDHIRTATRSFHPPGVSPQRSPGISANTEARRPVDLAAEIPPVLGHRAAVRYRLRDLCLVRCAGQLHLRAGVPTLKNLIRRPLLARGCAS